MTSFLEKDRAEIGKRKKPRFLDKENPLEKVIEKKVCDFGETLGIENRKYQNPARRAAPDRILFTPRNLIIEQRIVKLQPLVWFIEFKRRGLKPSDSQLKEHEFYRSLGFYVFVVDNVEEGIFIMRLMTEPLC